MQVSEVVGHIHPEPRVQPTDVVERESAPECEEPKTQQRGRRAAPLPAIPDEREREERRGPAGNPTDTTTRPSSSPREATRCAARAREAPPRRSPTRRARARPDRARRIGSRVAFHLDRPAEPGALDLRAGRVAGVGIRKIGPVGAGGAPSRGAGAAFSRGRARPTPRRGRSRASQPACIEHAHSNEAAAAR